MAVKAVKKEYAVDYKTVNKILKAKRKELESLQKKVTVAAKVSLELQIKAMNLIIQTCKSGKMTSKYPAA
jgi:hypothetical protein